MPEGSGPQAPSGGEASDRADRPGPDRPGPPVRTVGAVVVGAGPNGLVAANALVDAGWDVLVLEAQGSAAATSCRARSRGARRGDC